MYNTLTALALLTTLTTALSLPTKRGDSGPVIWTSPDGKGNTKVRFGDEKVYVGACDPKNVVIKSVYDNCYDEGFCNSASWSLQCEQSDAATHTITLTAPEGQYQPWIKNGLVEAIQAALGTDGVVETKTINAMSGGGCVGCPWKATPITVHYMPSTIGISHLNDGKVPDVITLNIVNEDDKADGGLCEILTGLGGSIAGSINGVAGGIFGVASLACKAI
ncbi:hypothetical protein E8E13_006168 [Curvularia kusanoi]|uniref:Uncharacterized protein n=1 Tax=Curvularia kusanoi TaxID=90978 RepID=A0A9P4TA35_CURKU|nr:hypothetical protein E8E13_006168 [Curvularia kusanoi]